MELCTGTWSESHRRACISLLPKQGKDLTLIGNWRPISLSPCDLKIITKSNANRLKVVLPGILCEAQAAYVPGRGISFNNIVIQCARRYAVNNGLDFSIVSLISSIISTKSLYSSDSNFKLAKIDSR